MPLAKLSSSVADNRPEVWLDEQDVIAAAQILSWIALPHRPEAGVNLLCQWFWARKRHRGEIVPELSFELKKPNRLGPQLESFRQKVLRSFRAGDWFQWKVMSGPERPAMLENFSVSTRQLAERRATIRRSAPANEIRDVWSRRKPVAHMAAAAASAIAAEHRARDVLGFDLEMTVFNPVWVSVAIEQAESRARAAELIGAFERKRLYHFRRGAF